MQIRVHDIDWETDGMDTEELGLPTEVILDTEEQGIENPNEPDDEIANVLSDTYSFLVRGFSYETLPGPTNS